MFKGLAKKYSIQYKSVAFSRVECYYNFTFS